VKNSHIIGGGLAALGLLLLSSKKEEEEGASIGWGPALDPELADAYEQQIAARTPVDLEPFESETPLCGAFYQAQRKDTFLGTGSKSITYRALYQTVLENTNSKREAEAIARSSMHRLSLFGSIVAGCWNDLIYGTHAYRAASPVGPHGRTVDLRPCHADNRERMLDGDAPARTVDLGAPGDGNTGNAARQARGRSMPYLWIPFIDVDAVLRGRVTTLGCDWPDGESGIEPPPEVRALGWAVM